MKISILYCLASLAVVWAAPGNGNQLSPAEDNEVKSFEERFPGFLEALEQETVQEAEISAEKQAEESGGVMKKQPAEKMAPHTVFSDVELTPAHVKDLFSEYKLDPNMFSEARRQLQKPERVKTLKTTSLKLLLTALLKVHNSTLKYVNYINSKNIPENTSVELKAAAQQTSQSMTEAILAMAKATNDMDLMFDLAFKTHEQIHAAKGEKL